MVDDCNEAGSDGETIEGEPTDEDDDTKLCYCRERSSHHLEFQLSREQVLVNLP